MKMWLGVCFMLATGCFPSGVRGEDTVTLTGTLKESSGGAVANTTLRLQRSGKGSCEGLEDFQSFQTDASGSFSKQIPGSDTLWLGMSRCFRLIVDPKPEGRALSVDFTIEETDVEVPNMVLVSGGLSQSANASGEWVVSVAKSTDMAASYITAQVQIPDGNVTLRNVGLGTDGTQFSFPFDELEDFEATASLSIRSNTRRDGTDFSMTRISDALRLPKGSVIPMSRGAACSYPRSPSTCVLTDGRLSTRMNVESGQLISEVMLSLPRAAVPKKVVAHQLSFEGNILVLEGATNAAGPWVTLASRNDPASTPNTFTVQTTDSFSFLRLRIDSVSPGTTPALSLAELSVFE